MDWLNILEWCAIWSLYRLSIVYAIVEIKKEWR